MSSLSYGSASTSLLQVLLIALIAASWCNASGDADLTEPFHRKGDDAKRPFGGGSFSRGRWVGQVSLTPWPMSKYVNRHDAKRHHNRERSIAQPREETDDPWLGQRYPVDKRPFGPGVYSRPSAHRTAKRPFGGGAIYSRPRDNGRASKSNYRRYGYSRERRERQFENSPNYDGRYDGDAMDAMSPDDASRAWLKLAEVLQRSRPPLYDGRDSNMNDYGDDDEYDLEFVDDEDKIQSQTGDRKLIGDF